jgi:hypothetical protein
MAGDGSRPRSRDVKQRPSLTATRGQAPIRFIVFVAHPMCCPLVGVAHTTIPYTGHPPLTRTAPVPAAWVGRLPARPRHAHWFLGPHTMAGYGPRLRLHDSGQRLLLTATRWRAAALAHGHTRAGDLAFSPLSRFRRAARAARISEPLSSLLLPHRAPSLCGSIRVYIRAALEPAAPSSSFTTMRLYPSPWAAGD